MSSGRVLAMELVAEDAIAKWRKLIGEMTILAARVSCRETHTCCRKIVANSMSGC